MPARSYTVRTLGMVATLACAAFTAVGLGTPSLAHGAERDIPLQITECDVSQYPQVRCSFTKNDRETSIPNFRLTENGDEVNDPRFFAGKLGQVEENPLPVIQLAIDASKTMSGPKLPAAQAAAEALLDNSREGDQIGVMTFNAEVNMLQQPTDDLDEVREAVGTAEIGAEIGTVMYDAILAAIDEFPEEATRRVILVLSDGLESQSDASIGDAIDAAKAADVEIYVVGIKPATGTGFDATPLEQLATETGGEFHEVTRVADLAPLYATLGQELLRGYWFEYETSQESGQHLALEMSASGYERAEFPVKLPFIPSPSGSIVVPPPTEAAPVQPAVPLPGGRLGVGLAATPFALILAMMIYSFLRRRSVVSIADRIGPYTIEGRNNGTADSKESRSAAFAPLFKATENLLGRTSTFRKMRAALETANLPMREVELLYLRIVTMLVIGPLGFAMFGLRPGIVSVFVGYSLPYWFVKFKARKRRKAFEDQLPDMLGAVSASLKAGHSFNQAINAVIKEAPDPTAEELNRCLTETRLGLPIEDALEGMARRLGSADFEFAVTAVNIQRQVGGSLAEILEMVGDTVRNRQQFKKKVKALTSMGRASAYVLLGVPFFIGGALTLMSPEYMHPLWFTDQGHKLIYVALGMMGLGWAACQKIVSFKV